MLVKCIIKVFLYLILAVMTLIHWLLKIPMILGNILLYFLSIIFILTGVLSYGFALESARECGRMIIIGMAFGAIPDFVPFLGKSLETCVSAKSYEFCNKQRKTNPIWISLNDRLLHQEVCYLLS